MLSSESVDHHGHALPVGREPRIQIGASRRGQRLLQTLSIDPHQPALGRLNAPRNIDQRSRRGNAVLGGAGAWRLHDALDDGDRRARHGEPLGIERHGHQVPPLRIDQVPGARITRLRAPWDQVPPFARSDRLDGNL